MNKQALTIVGLATIAAGITTAAVAATGDTGSNAAATLRLADGTEIGAAEFRAQDDAIEVQVALEVPPDATAVDSFHGFHIHANDDPANGDGCEADPAAEPAEWFVSADGHLKQEGQLHGGHDGDMAPLFLDSNGRAEATFTIEGFDIASLDGRVVIVHAGPDNLGNIPVGSEPNQYNPNSPDAVDRTQATGNAGDRVACGEVTVG
jgi:Cu-Zn family superoxide dismutase